MVDDESKEIINIRRTLKIITRSLDAINEELYLILDARRRKRPVNSLLLKRIVELDREGINFTADNLYSSAFKAIFVKQQFDEELLTLLKSGEIYLLGDIIYPIETLNDKGEPHGKIA
jgi:hypothetical protein